MRFLGLVLLVAVAWLLPCSHAISEDLRDIVIPAQADPAVRYAAEEFQAFFEKASGRKLSIVEKGTGEKPAGETGHVFIGPGDAMARSNVAIDTTDLGAEDLEIRLAGGNVAIAGGGPRGTLYGVYQFLEDVLGIRFLTSEHTHIPPFDAQVLRRERVIRYRPPLGYRHCYYRQNYRDIAFGVRLRNNALSGDPKYGGYVSGGLVGHSVHHYVPTEKYGKEHPEYFALIDGERRWDVAGADASPQGTQPCLTNPDVRKLIIDGVLKDLAEHPQWKSISVGQSDNYYYCRCDQCEALHQREGAPAGSWLSLVNEVADAVAKAHPDVLVGTYAYQITREPPRHLRPRPNVALQIPTIEACQMHPLDDPDCPRNAETRADISGWGRICDRIYIWNYITTFPDYQMPVPNLWSIGPNLRYFVANHCRGVFMQGPGQAHVAEIAELRNYLTCRLMWNPQLDDRQVIDEFVRLHYGAAAGPMHRYLNLIHDPRRLADVHFHPFGLPENYGITPEIGEQAVAIFNDALAAAENDTVLRRVEKASLAAWRARISDVVTLVRGGEKIPPDLAERQRPHAENYYRLCAKFGADYASESSKLADERAGMQAAFAEAGAAFRVNFDDKKQKEFPSDKGP